MQLEVPLVPVRGGRCPRCWILLSDDIAVYYPARSKALWRLARDGSRLCYACSNCPDVWPDGLMPGDDGEDVAASVVGGRNDVASQRAIEFVFGRRPSIVIPHGSSLAGTGGMHYDEWPGIGEDNLFRYHMLRLQVTINDLAYRLANHTTEPLPVRSMHPQRLAQLFYDDSDMLIHRVYPFPPDGSPVAIPNIAPEVAKKVVNLL